MERVETVHVDVGHCLRRGHTCSMLHPTLSHTHCNNKFKVHCIQISFKLVSITDVYLSACVISHRETKSV
jgi:hypothetical protein